MILAVDVYYDEAHAVAAGVLFQDWPDPVSVREITVPVSPVAGYRPGEFYLRELPCILAVAQRLATLPRCIVIDGYVYLGDSRKPGLGRHVYDALGGKVPVIGVAKSRFKNSPPETALFRGASKRPLYVTAAGMDPEEAQRCILTMHGRHRLPTLLKRADQLCRSG